MSFNRETYKININACKSAIKKQRQLVKDLTKQFNNTTKPDEDGFVLVAHGLNNKLHYEKTRLNDMYRTLQTLQNGSKNDIFGWCKCYDCRTMSTEKYARFAHIVLRHIAVGNNLGVPDAKRNDYIRSLINAAYAWHTDQDKKQEYLKFIETLEDNRFDRFWNPEFYLPEKTNIIDTYLLCDTCSHSKKCSCLCDNDHYYKLSITDELPEFR